MADVLWIGDSYGTGFQPTGGRVTPAPLQFGNLMGLVVDNQSVNASGYVESGDRYSFLQQVERANDGPYEYVMVMGGRNDNSDNYSMVMQTFDAIKNRWPDAKVFTAFLWDSRWRMTEVQTNNLSNIAMLSRQWGYVFLDHATYWFTGNDSLFCYNDIHPNAAGTERMAQSLVQCVRTGIQPIGDCVLNLEMTGGCEGILNICIHDGLARMGGKWTAWPTGTTSGTTVAFVPACMGRVDDFILFLNDAGNSMGFMRIAYDAGQGLLQYVGAVGGGDMKGNCFMPLTTIDCGRVGQF